MLEMQEMLKRKIGARRAFRGSWGRAQSRLGLPLAVLVGVLLGAGPAAAVTIAGLGTLDPAYFNPKNQVGLAVSQTPDLTISPTVPQIRVCNVDSPACTNPDIAVTQTLGTIWQRPQTNGVTPSPAFPYVADVTFTFERKTPPPGSQCAEFDGEGECGPIDPVLVAFAAFLDPYTTSPPVALDLSGLGGAAPLLVLERVTGGTPKQFPAVLLPGLDVGETHSIVVRYVIGGAMQPNPLGGFDLPGIAMTGFEGQVPEPASGLLLLGGLIGVTTGARRQRNRR